jgi:dipeptidyl aminopeptidase/acylaminoacyl peptidase
VTHSARTTPRRRLAALVITLAVAWTGAYTLTSAQTPEKRALTVEDYTRWRSISGQEMSSDGAWVAYVLQFTNTAPADAKPVLHLLKLDSNQDVSVPNATGAVFSSDAKWLAYQVDPSGGRGGRGGGGRAGGGGAQPAAPAPAAPADTSAQNAQGRGRAAATPAAPRHVELRNLATGAIQQWQDIQSFSFSPTATHLLLRRRPVTADGARGGASADNAGGGGGGGGGQAAGGAGAAAEATGPRGVEVILHNLANGQNQLLASVADSAFNRAGDLLAYTVDGAVKDSNGLFVMDLKSGRVTMLDNDSKVYNRMAWNESGNAIAVLKGVDVDKMRERNNMLVVYRSVTSGDQPAGAPVVLDPAKAAGFPANWVVSDRAALSWSDDSNRVFFGMKEQVPAPPAAAPRRNADETPDVDVWNTLDERIQSMQMIRADQDRNFTFREAFDVAQNKFVKLADQTMRDLDIASDGKWAVGRDTRGYISDYKPAAADIYRVSTSTGERTLMFKNQLIGSSVFGISPDGRLYLYWKDSKYQAYDLDAGTTKTLGGAAPLPLTNTEYDHPGVKPSYGVAGYTSDGKSVIVQGRYDLWALPLDGSAAKNLTNGAGTQSEIRYRYVRTEPVDPAAGGAPGGGGGRGGGRGGRDNTIDLSKPVTLSAYGEWTKKAGFSELTPDGKLREIVYEDAAFSNPTKAAKADKYLFARQTFAEFPDLRVSGADFKTSTKITDANPQQSEFLWGHRQLFEFKDRFGHRLQGLLTFPDDYKPGEKRPMLVTFYEDNSQNLNRYSSPTYVTGMGAVPMQATTQGYIVMIPDVHYHTGPSHSDQLDSVESAVKKVIEMGVVDPKHIGLNGHSYGGEGAAFIATRSRLFAAVGVGAGVVDLFNDFNMNWGWSYQVSGGSGANGDDYYLYGQGREAVSPWDKPDMYHFESALTHVPEVTQPILIMHGTADPTVGFINGLAFYNALRYNGKNAILLAYPGEGHGLRGLANRKDLTVRYFQFFDHYLKGAPAPKWMTDGVPYLDKDANKEGGSGRGGGR